MTPRQAVTTKKAQGIGGSWTKPPMLSLTSRRVSSSTMSFSTRNAQWPRPEVRGWSRLGCPPSRQAASASLRPGRARLAPVRPLSVNVFSGDLGGRERNGELFVLHREAVKGGVLERGEAVFPVAAYCRVGPLPDVLEEAAVAAEACDVVPVALPGCRDGFRGRLAAVPPGNQVAATGIADG